MKRQQDLLRGPILKGVISYTLPIICTSLLQLMFNMADIAVIGQRHGGDPVAAVGATHSLSRLILNMFLGLSIGVGINVAHGVGGRKNRETHQTVHTALPLAFICGVLVSLIGVLFCEDFLILMGTPRDILPMATLYMRIYFGGVTFMVVYNFCAAILRAVGDTKSPLIFLSISGLLNVVLNFVFVYFFDMKVEGVALATVISQALSAVLVIRALLKRTDSCKLNLKQMRFYPASMKKILRLGLPAGLQNCMFSLSNVVVQSSINSFGTAFVSGNAAASNPENILYFSMNAFQQTAVNYVGQNIGAHQYKRVRKVILSCLGCVLVMGVTLGILVDLFAAEILSLYIPGETQAISYGVDRLMWLAIPYVLCGFMDVSTGSLRGMGASLLPTLITILGVCGLRIGWVSFVFSRPAFHTPGVLYTTYLLSWTATFLALGAVLIVTYKKHLKKYCPVQ